jgi:regulator of replication initiation timing
MIGDVQCREALEENRRLFVENNELKEQIKVMECSLKRKRLHYSQSSRQSQTDQGKQHIVFMLIYLTLLVFFIQILRQVF